MKGILSGRVSLRGGGAALPQPGPTTWRRPLEIPAGCGCDPDKIHAIHAYLSEHFPGYVLRHFHAASRLIQLGMPAQFAERHVVSLAHGATLPYYGVFTSGFLDEHAADALACDLETWNVAGSLRAYYVAIVSQDGVTSL